MLIQVRSFAMVREIIGQKEITINLTENSTLKAGLDHIFGLYPDLENLMLTQDRKYNSMYLIMVNDQEIPIERYDWILSPNDQIIIIPPAGGG